MMKTTLAAFLCAGLLAVSPSPAMATPFSFSVDVNTTSLIPLIGTNGPFYLDFQLNNGSALGTSSAQIGFFSFGAGGSATGSPTLFGGATGSLSSGVGLTDSSAFPEFYQPFIPGTQLSFLVTLSPTSVDPVTPDSFVFAILATDPILGLVNIPTNGLGDSLVHVDLTATTLRMGNVDTSGGTGAFGGVTVTASPVPEPASFFLLAAGLAGVGARRWRLRHARS